jgi:hypothetical protein
MTGLDGLVARHLHHSPKSMMPIDRHTTAEMFSETRRRRGSFSGLRKRQRDSWRLSRLDGECFSFINAARVS